jgi:sterol desaturase/sphingolipid hydroxylase (fatty acid hydroxylase superfamily)
MSHAPINHSPEPIRLFKSDFLEVFTHISPLAVVVIWLPVILYLLGRAIYWLGIAGAWPVSFLLGLVLWMPTEYLLHRFVFHFRPRNAWQERVTFLFHGIHHAQPQIKTRLVMPPVVSIPMAAVIYGLLYGVVGVLLKAPGWVDGLMSGLLFGYLIYDITHYATHHFPMRGKLLKYLKRYHMLHHYKTPDQRFGVSSPLWDWVFGTMPREG